MASGALTRPLGFALRLHRSMLAGFGAGVFLMGAMYGSILGQADEMLKDIDPIQEALRKTGGTMAESFASMVMVVLAVVASVYVMMAALRPRSEENAGRAEPLLATGLSRARWAGSHLAVSLAGGTLLLLLAGLGIGVAGAASSGDSRPGALPDGCGARLRTGAVGHHRGRRGPLRLAAPGGPGRVGGAGVRVRGSTTWARCSGSPAGRRTCRPSAMCPSCRPPR